MGVGTWNSRTWCSWTACDRPSPKGGRGGFVATRVDEIGVRVLKTLLERNPQVDPLTIEDLGLGNVMGVPEFANFGGNHIARLAGLPESVCSFDVSRQCGSSMESLHRVAQSIMVGATATGISMGAERMGRNLGGVRRRRRPHHEVQQATLRAEQRAAESGPAPPGRLRRGVARLHPGFLAGGVHGADRPERRGGLRADARATGRVRRGQPPQVRRRAGSGLLPRRDHPLHGRGAGLR